MDYFDFEEEEELMGKNFEDPLSKRMTELENEVFEDSLSKRLTQLENEVEVFEDPLSKRLTELEKSIEDSIERNFYDIGEPPRPYQQKTDPSIHGAFNNEVENEFNLGKEKLSRNYEVPVPRLRMSGGSRTPYTKRSSPGAYPKSSISSTRSPEANQESISREDLEKDEEERLREEEERRKQEKFEREIAERDRKQQEEDRKMREEMSAMRREMEKNSEKWLKEYEKEEKEYEKMMKEFKEIERESLVRMFGEEEVDRVEKYIMTMNSGVRDDDKGDDSDDEDWNDEEWENW